MTATAIATRYLTWWLVGIACIAACGGRSSLPGMKAYNGGSSQGPPGSITELTPLGPLPGGGQASVNNAGPPCPGTDCDGGCVSPATDPLNCGACQFRCSAGQSCQAGACVDECSGPRTRCGSSWADLATDTSNCGTCGLGCLRGQICVNGACACPASQTLCGSACTDMTVDARNCGGCGIWCWTPGSLEAVYFADGGLATDPASYGATAFVQGTDACIAGECVNVDLCSGNYTRCSFQGGACVDLTTDINCGGCGNLCQNGSSCIAEKCTCAGVGLAYCNGACIDISSSAANCGGCGIVCPSGMSCRSGQCEGACPQGQSICDGACIDLQTSASHCGLCDQVCGGNLVCIQGQCACPSGTSDCAGTCVDTNTDNQNCSACAKTCSGTCVGGTCQ